MPDTSTSRLTLLALAAANGVDLSQLTSFQISSRSGGLDQSAAEDELDRLPKPVVCVGKVDGSSMGVSYESPNSNQLPLFQHRRNQIQEGKGPIGSLRSLAEDGSIEVRAAGVVTVAHRTTLERWAAEVLVDQPLGIELLEPKAGGAPWVLSFSQVRSGDPIAALQQLKARRVP